MADVAVPRSLWSHRDFTIFWTAQTLSEVGNVFALVALPLLVLQATGSVAQMGLLTAVSAVGSIGTGLFVGALVDRLDRRRLMIACDLIRLVLYAAIPIFWLVRPQVWLLFVVMALTSVAEMTFKIAYVAALPTLVDRSQVVEANGRLETTNAIAYIAGPVLAGVIAASAGLTTAIAINAASFAVSAAGLFLIRLRPTDGPPSTAAPWHSFRDGFLAGAAFLWRTPVLRALTILLTIVTFLSLGMTDVFIYQVRNGLGQGDRMVGYVLSVAGAGTVIAAAVTARLRRTLGFGVCWLGAYVVCGIAVAVLGLSTNLNVVAAMVLAYTFGMGLAGICSMSLRQQITPDRLLGRVTSAFWTIHSVFAPLGAAALTALVGRFGARTPLLGVGAVFLVVVAVGLFTPIRQRHPERRPGAATLPDLFEEQVRRSPDATAAVLAGGSLSYRDLNARANRLAHKLIAAGSGPERVVALRLHRSLDLVVGVLAVLKTGAAYLPLDPEHPVDRNTRMIEDATPLRVVDATWFEDLATWPEHDPPRKLRPDDAAYVIYTSGSTGVPKGVVVSHHNVVRLFHATDRWFGFGPADVWTLFHTYTFDFSVWELWGALRYGGRLVVVPHEVSRSPKDFLDLLAWRGDISAVLR